MHLYWGNTRLRLLLIVTHCPHHRQHKAIYSTLDKTATLPQYRQLTLYQSGLTKLHIVTFVQRIPQYIKMMKSSKAMCCHYKMKCKSFRSVALVIYIYRAMTPPPNQKLQRGILFAACAFRISCIRQRLEIPSGIIIIIISEGLTTRELNNTLHASSNKFLRYRRSIQPLIIVHIEQQLTARTLTYTLLLKKKHCSIHIHTS